MDYDALVEHMVQRFLMWKLPKTFAPDAGVIFSPSYSEEPMRSRHWPTGTNLLNYPEAKEMVLHMLEGSPDGP